MCGNTVIIVREHNNIVWKHNNIVSEHNNIVWEHNNYCEGTKEKKIDYVYSGAP